MNLSLLLVATVTWIFWGAFLAVRQRSLKVGSQALARRNLRTTAITLLVGLGVVLNFGVFLVVYGLRTSWGISAATVLGGYGLCMAFFLGVRALGGSGAWVAQLARLALIALPAGALALWLLMGLVV